MTPARLVIPLVNRHMAGRAGADLPQPLMPLRVAALAARDGIAAVDETGPLIAEAAPGRLPAGVN